MSDQEKYNLLPYYDYQLGRVWVEDDKTAAKLFIKDFLATRNRNEDGIGRTQPR